MNCTEFHELAPAYALDALSEAERMAALHHLEHEGPHEGCEALVARYERTVDDLSSSVRPVVVPPSLWRVIEARLGLGSAAQGASEGGTVTPISQLSPQPSRWREGLAWAAAAAALLGALWSHQTAQRTAVAVLEERDKRVGAEQSLANTSGELARAEAARNDCNRALQQLTRESELGRGAVALLEQPGTRVAPMGPAGAQTYRATTLFNAESKRAVVLSTSVPRVEGKDYELWIIAAGESVPRPAGFLRFDPSGVAIGEFDAALLAGKAPAAFAISLEPAGGRPTPTEVVLLGKLAT